MSSSAPVLSADAVKAAALASRFTLVGLAPAEALDPGPLQAWLGAGYAADMDWMARRRDRMKALRKRLLALDPALETYAAVDTGVVMEKVCR